MNLVGSGSGSGKRFEESTTQKIQKNSSLLSSGNSSKQKYMDQFMNGRKSHHQSFVSNGEDIEGTAKFIQRPTADFGLVNEDNF